MHNIPITERSLPQIKPFITIDLDMGSFRQVQKSLTQNCYGVRTPSFKIEISQTSKSLCELFFQMARYIHQNERKKPMDDLQRKATLRAFFMNEYDQPTVFFRYFLNHLNDTHPNLQQYLACSLTTQHSPSRKGQSTWHQNMSWEIQGMDTTAIYPIFASCFNQVSELFSLVKDEKIELVKINRILSELRIQEDNHEWLNERGFALCMAGGNTRLHKMLSSLIQPPLIAPYLTSYLDKLIYKHNLLKCVKEEAYQVHVPFSVLRILGFDEEVLDKIDPQTCRHFFSHLDLKRYSQAFVANVLKNFLQDVFKLHLALLQAAHEYRENFSKSNHEMIRILGQLKTIQSKYPLIVERITKNTDLIRTKGEIKFEFYPDPTSTHPKSRLLQNCEAQMDYFKELISHTSYNLVKSIPQTQDIEAFLQPIIKRLQENPPKDPRFLQHAEGIAKNPVRYGLEYIEKFLNLVWQHDYQKLIRSGDFKEEEYSLDDFIAPKKFALDQAIKHTIGFQKPLTQPKLQPQSKQMPLVTYDCLIHDSFTEFYGFADQMHKCNQAFSPSTLLTTQSQFSMDLHELLRVTKKDGTQSGQLKIKKLVDVLKQSVINELKQNHLSWHFEYWDMYIQIIEHFKIYDFEKQKDVFNLLMQINQTFYLFAKKMNDRHEYKKVRHEILNVLNSMDSLDDCMAYISEMNRLLASCSTDLIHLFTMQFDFKLTDIQIIKDQIQTLEKIYVKLGEELQAMMRSLHFPVNYFLAPQNIHHAGGQKHQIFFTKLFLNFLQKNTNSSSHLSSQLPLEFISPDNFLDALNGVDKDNYKKALKKININDPSDQQLFMYWFIKRFQKYMPRLSQHGDVDSNKYIIFLKNQPLAFEGLVEMFKKLDAEKAGKSFFFSASSKINESDLNHMMREVAEQVSLQRSEDEIYPVGMLFEKLHEADLSALCKYLCDFKSVFAPTSKQ